MLQLTFDSARFECLKRKMSLVSLATVEENMCLQQQLAELGSFFLIMVCANILKLSKHLRAWQSASVDWFGQKGPRQFYQVGEWGGNQLF